MTEIGNFISQIGFPIFVAVWMLVKTSKESQATRDTLAELKTSIDILANEVSHHQRKDGEKNE